MGGLLRPRRNRPAELGVLMILLGEYGAAEVWFGKDTELDIMLDVAILLPPHFGHLRGDVSVEEG